MSRSHFHPHKLETAGAPPVSGRRPVFLTAPCFVLPGLCLCVTSMRKGERDGGLPTLAPPPLRSVGSAPTCPWPRLLMHRGGGSVEQPVPVPHPTIQASLRHLGWRRAVSWASMSSAGTWAGRVGTRGVQLYPRTQGAGAAGESPAKRGSRDGRVPGPGDALSPWPPASWRLLSRPCRWPRGRRRRTGQAGPPRLDFVQWASGPQGRGREEMV